MMIKNSTKKALLEVGDFTRQTIIIYGISTVYYTIHVLCFQMKIPTNGGESV